MRKTLKAITDIYPITPITLVDIGARWGVQRPWNNIPSQCLNYYGFEADLEECRRLNEKSGKNNSVTYFPVVLSDRISKEILYLTEEEGCSSIYKPSYECINKYYFHENWRVKKEISVDTSTLKIVLEHNNIDPDFVKIDTQGAELKILKGANGYLENVLGLELEVEFVKWYENQPLFSDVNSFVSEKGFDLFDLNRYWANRVNIDKHSSMRGQLIFADAVYFRSTNSFYSLNFLSPEQKREKLLKMICVLTLYGFFDVAVEFLQHPETPLSEKEIGLLKNVLVKMSIYPRWQKILFDNSIANKAGRFLQYIGNLLTFKSKTIGWGTDYNIVDGRYMYHDSSILSSFFGRK